ncbi:hypothetical protein AK830_g5797 [Neonectria ditissima]|uniref:WW domain-containing oxidoreductase n=1 Tax=Neonectria ditissima TaxID=78410 RepID=A0A0P7B322_9HYPO|nr:hypothetical protein AK830_g5797 [Neonectria ditissima]
MSSKLGKDVPWESSMRGTLYKQLRVHPKPLQPRPNLQGQTAIITGGNGGLGLEAGRQLLDLGLSNLILAVRSQAKGDAAAAKLREEFPDSTIDVSILDMADYSSILSFGDRCRNLQGSIDYVILNAGLQNSSFEKNSETGHEAVMQTNYLSTVLLLLLLIPIVKEKHIKTKINRPPVITIVGSDTMYFSTFDSPGSIFAKTDDPDRFSKMQNYSDSKFLLMMFIARLAEKVDPDDVLINVCNPGLTGGTSLGHEGDALLNRIVISLFTKAVGRSLFSGASNYIHALLGEGKQSHGSFVSEWSIKPYAAAMYTEAGNDLADKLWQETKEELKFASKVGAQEFFSS